jgi:plasmid segregation protein ParM
LSLNTGIDVGFGNVKGESDLCKIDFCSQIGEFSPVKFSSGMEGATDPTLNMAIEYNGKRWFVGPSAVRQAVPQNTIEHTRTVTEEGQILMLSALGILAGNETQTNLVVGLPVKQYSDLKDRYIVQASGTHVFSYLTMTGEVKSKKVITVKNLKVLPQPFGTVFDIILDENGKVKDPKAATGKIGVVDIGYNTLDLLRADSLQYINKRSTSFSDYGMFAVYRELSSLIQGRYHVEIPPEKLEQIVRRGTVNIAGRTQPINDLKQQAFETVANVIASRIQSYWPDNWELDKIVITGGGAVHLGSFICPSFAQSEISNDPLYSNVNGYYKCARFTWRD